MQVVININSIVRKLKALDQKHHIRDAQKIHEQQNLESY